MNILTKHDEIDKLLAAQIAYEIENKQVLLAGVYNSITTLDGRQFYVCIQETRK